MKRNSKHQSPEAQLTVLSSSPVFRIDLVPLSYSYEDSSMMSKSQMLLHNVVVDDDDDDEDCYITESPKKRGYNDSCRTDSFDSGESTSADSLDDSKRSNETLDKMLQYLKSETKLTNNNNMNINMNSSNNCLNYCSQHHIDERDCCKISYSSSMPRLSMTYSSHNNPNRAIKRAKTFNNLVVLESNSLLESIDVGGIFL